VFGVGFEGFSVSDAALKKFRPFGDCGKRVCFFRQETPESGMVPTEIIAAGIPVRANAVAKFDYLRHQLIL
jgi:hypothetical protein